MGQTSRHSSSRQEAGSPILVSARDFQLAVFDLDGVLTRTAEIHAQAWKGLFDGYLARREGPEFRPFDLHEDYLALVDGKPRLDGVRDFLASRGISLPVGDPGDAPGDASLWALGNSKDRLFQQVLKDRGVVVYEPAVALLQGFRAAGVGLALVSASRNCQRVLEVAGLEGAFDLVIDGQEAARAGLAGKPAGDCFAEAARRMGVPAPRALVLEDAVAGVAAGRAAGFGLVVGVCRDGDPAPLLSAGAHRVVERLDRIQPRPLPRALDAFHEIQARLEGRPPALFLDYDGTLTPIVSRPQDAVLGSGMRSLLQGLSRCCEVVIATGRALDVIREMVPVDGIVLCANHGFDIDTGDGELIRHPQVEALARSVIPALAAELERQLRQVPGALVEPKAYSVAVHDRLVAVTQRPRVEEAVLQALGREPGLRLLRGKQVLELVPDVDWDKGAAVTLLARRGALDPAQLIYIGDDVTDESAFEVVRSEGSAIVVQSRPRPTVATYRLGDCAEVERFLGRLLASLRERAGT